MQVSDNALNPLQRIWRLRLLRFASGGLLNLFNRLLLVFVFSSLGLPLALNYAIVHLITFIFAFFYHSKVTFGVRLSVGGLKRFAGSVVLIRLLDYAFVLVATQSAQLLQWVSSIPHLGDFLGAQLLYINVLIASAITFVVRYLIFTRFTFSEGIRSRTTRRGDK